MLLCVRVVDMTFHDHMDHKLKKANILWIKLFFC